MCMTKFENSANVEACKLRTPKFQSEEPDIGQRDGHSACVLVPGEDYGIIMLPVGLLP